MGGDINFDACKTNPRTSTPKLRIEFAITAGKKVWNENSVKYYIDMGIIGKYLGRTALKE